MTKKRLRELLDEAHGLLSSVAHGQHLMGSHEVWEFLEKLEKELHQSGMRSK